MPNCCPCRLCSHHRGVAAAIARRDVDELIGLLRQAEACMFIGMRDGNCMADVMETACASSIAKLKQAIKDEGRKCRKESAHV